MILRKNNQLVRAKHLLINLGNSNFKAEINDLDVEIQGEMQGYMEKFDTKIVTIRDEIDELEKLPSLRKQYTEMIQLYRNAVELVEDLRKIKKVTRELIKIQARNKKVVKNG